MTYIHLAQNWLVNHRNNLQLIEFVDDKYLTISSREKGRTAEQILRHMVKNKFDWLRNLSPKQDFELPDIDETSLESLEKTSSDWIMKLIEIEANGKPVTGYKSDFFGFVIYLIAHDAHHRGQILQMLRDNDVSVDNNLKYGIWDWKY